MNISTTDKTLNVSGFRELTAGNASEVKGQLRVYFAPELLNIDMNCSALEFLDSSGLGALISLQKMANERGGKLRLLSPKPVAMQILELTRLHRIFEIVA